MQTRREFAQVLLGAAAAGAMPAKKSLLQLQQEFLDLRFGMFIHLNMATFEEREWGDPKASPKLFNPAHLDTDQWAEAAASAGMTYACLTTKHHDGFCLWPTATTSPSVKDATFTRDVVGSYAESFRKHGLKVCLYYSILDLRANIRHYNVTRAKIDLIKAQLSELLTHYGEVHALIFDGWDAPWSRITYDEVPFREIYTHIKRLQPNCLITDHNASHYPGSALYYTDIKQYEQHAGQLIPPGSFVPSQSGTTLQRDWFWKRDYPNQPVAPVKQIVDQWLVPLNERHSNLILNAAPNSDGQFDRNVRERLAEIGKAWKHAGPAAKISASPVITTPNLAYGRPSSASSCPDTVGPDMANDENFDSYWSPAPGETTGWLEITFDRPTTINTVSIAEPRHLESYGPQSRIASYRVQQWKSGAWADLVTGREPSAPQLHQFATVQASRVRLFIEASKPGVGIAEFGLYAEP